MPTISPRAIPPWHRPIRIPESIPLSHAEPPYVLTDAVTSWRMPFILAHDVPAGSDLRLQLWGGRNNRGPFTGIQFDNPHAPGFLHAALADGTPLPIRAAEQAGSFCLGLPVAGLRQGDTVTVFAGDPAVPGSGVKAWQVHVYDKFCVLYVMPVKDPEKPLPAWTGGATWSDTSCDRIVAACTMHFLGGPIARLRAYAPAFARPGQPFNILIRAEDANGNLSCEEMAGVELSGQRHPLAAQATPVADSTCLRAQVTLQAEGVHRIRVRECRTGLEAETNPVVCSPRAEPVYWGMIHGHTEMSDGIGNMDRYYHQLKNEVRLDFGALSDHDHRWETPDRYFLATAAAAKRWHEPGVFTTFLGYEWAKWRKNGDGDRNVYYREDDRPMYRSDDGDYPAPPDLFRALRAAGEKAIVIPHHTGHGGNFCDWKDHDPEIERLVEIFQVRGSFECAAEDGNPVPEINTQVPPYKGGYVRNALAMGWRVGFTAGGDDHDGQWGTEASVQAGAIKGGRYKQGMMSVEASSNTRAALFEALRQRRVTATSGPRMLLTYRLDGHPMGSELSLKKAPGLAACRRLEIEFHGTAAIDRIDIIRNNAVAHSVPGTGIPDAAVTWVDCAPIGGLWMPAAKYCDHPFAFYYVRAVQKDGEVAWASPVWIDP